MSNPFSKNKILDAKEYIEQKQIKYNTAFFKLKENKCLTKHNSKKHQKLVRAVNQKHKLDLHKGYFLTQNKCFKQECRPVNMNDGKNTIIGKKNCTCKCFKCKKCNCKKNCACRLKCRCKCKCYKCKCAYKCKCNYRCKCCCLCSNKCAPNCREEKGLITPRAYLKHSKKTSDLMLNQTNHMQFYYEKCIDSQKCCMCKCKLSECVCERCLKCGLLPAKCKCKKCDICCFPLHACKCHENTCCGKAHILPKKKH